MDMVACDNCKSWFHFTCVGVDQTIQDVPWTCEKCRQLEVNQNLIEKLSVVDVTITNAVDQRGNSSQTNPRSITSCASSTKSNHSTVKARLDYLDSLQEARERQALEEDRARKEARERRMRLVEEAREAREHRTRIEEARLADEEREVNDRKAEEDRAYEEEARVRAQRARDEENLLKLRYEALIEDDGGSIASSKNSKRLSVSTKENTQRWVHQQLYGKSAPDNKIFDRQPNYARRQEVDIKNCQDSKPTAINIKPMEQIIKTTALNSSHIAARQVLSRDLPSFIGYDQDWPLFYSSFTQSTARCGYSHAENLIRLQKSLTGEALKAVCGHMTNPEMVPDIIETLEMLFGRPNKILNSLINEVMQEPVIKPGHLNMLVTFALAAKNLCATIENLNKPEYLTNPMLVEVLVEKLPDNFKVEWGRLQRNGDVSLKAFSVWIFELAKDVNNVSSAVPSVNHNVEQKPNLKNRLSRQKGYFNGNHTQSKVPAKSTKQENKPEGCPVCKGPHQVDECKSFLEMKTSQRWEAIKKHGICGVCLKVDHYYKRCTVTKACGVDECRSCHHHLLHFRKQEASENKPPTPSTSSATVSQHEVDRSVLFKIVPATL